VVQRDPAYQVDASRKRPVSLPTSDGHGSPGIASRVFSALATGGINVVAIAQGSSERNISLVVAESDATRAVRALHQAFRLERTSASV